MSAEKKSMDPAVLAAIITVVGGIVVALISTLAGRSASQPDPTSPPPPTSVPATLVVNTPVPTDIVPTVEPTFTPMPPTDIPTATFTTVPSVPLGEDWLAGCISAFWQIYPANIATAPKGDGCLQEPVYVFSAEHGDLDFLANNADGIGVYGLFAPLPTESGSVTFGVRLRTLDHVDILMGVYTDADVNSQGLLMTIPEGNVKNRIIVQKDNMTSYTTLQQTSNLAQGDQGYSFTFTYSLNSIRSSVNPSVFVTNPLSAPSSRKWIFLGYRVLSRSYSVDATYFGFQLAQ